MTETEQSEVVKQLKRLKNKAELCRYAHEQMRKDACFWRRATSIAVAVLSFFLSVLVIMLYRYILPGDSNAWLVILAVLTPLILLVQSIGSIFGWGEKESQCGTAIHIWGEWIRKADFLEKKIPQISKEVVQEKMAEMEREYVECMGKTPPIPARKFSCYKVEYRQSRMLSEKIDNASDSELADISRELGCRKPGKH